MSRYKIKQYVIGTKNKEKEIRTEIIKKKFEQHIPTKTLATDYNVSEEKIEQWINDYQFYGWPEISSSKKA